MIRLLPENEFKELVVKAKAYGLTLSDLASTATNSMLHRKMC